MTAPVKEGLRRLGGGHHDPPVLPAGFARVDVVGISAVGGHDGVDTHADMEPPAGDPPRRR